MEDLERTIKSLTRTAYDIQDFRLRVGGRLVQNFRSKLGLDNGEDDEGADQEEQVNVLRTLKRRYKSVTDGIALSKLTRRRSYEYDGVITTYGELLMINHYLRLSDQEESLFRDLGSEITKHPLWDALLEDVKGVGPAMAGVIISEFDPHAGKYVSSFWKYAGLDVAPDGRARSRREEHLVEREYEAADGTTKTRKSITYNKFLHDKLLGVLGPCLLRASGDFKDIYDDYRHRLEHEERHDDKTDGHKHRMAIRYMVKMLVKEIYKAWRPIEGLPVRDGYREAKLGKEPHGAGA